MTKAQEIKKFLISKGYSAKDFRCSMRSSGYSVSISIKNPRIDLEVIETLVKPFEKVRYCEYTNEILQGCNFFVFVQYDVEKLPEEYVDAFTLARAMVTDYQPNAWDGPAYHLKKTIQEIVPVSMAQAAMIRNICDISLNL